MIFLFEKCNNNNKFLYSAIPHQNLRVRGAVHYQHQNPLDNQKSTSTIKAYISITITIIVQELCESRGGRPGLSVLTSLLVSVDVKIY